MDPRTHNRQAFPNGAAVRMPGPLAQILALVIIAALAIVGFMIFIPLLIIAGIALALFIAWNWVKLKLRRAHAPNGPLDGRRNVRVIRRDE
ncbi:MAG: hypothetical protein AAGA55_06495 [Planctomycetota bacterium]